MNNFSKVEAFPNKNKLLSIEILNKEAGIIQLPCPEFTYLGSKRPGMIKKEYDTLSYRKHCQELLEPIFNQLKDYLASDNCSLYFLGIKESPSCGVFHSCSSNSAREVAATEETGVFTEELLKASNKYEIALKLLEVDEKDIARIIDEIDKI